MKKACITEGQLYEVFRAHVATFPTQHAAAQDAGVSDAYIGDVLKMRRTIGPTLLQWLGVELVPRYRQKQEG